MTISRIACPVVTALGIFVTSPANALCQGGINAEIDLGTACMAFVASSVEIAPGEVRRINVDCPGGSYRAISGGLRAAEITNDPPNQGHSLRIQESYPDGRTWVIFVRNRAGSARPPHTVIATATCIRDDP